MALSAPPFALPSRPQRRYLRPPAPVHFPVEEQVPESLVHRQLLSLLFAIVKRGFGDRALISSDQFLYWDPTNPKQCLAPDLAVRLGAAPLALETWKTWELGAPHLGVEIASASDAAERELEAKLARYRQAGVLEVARFDPGGSAPPRLWDLMDGDLVERDPSDPAFMRCDALGLYWCVVPDPELGATFRLAHDREGRELLLTGEEAERAAKEAERAAKEAERAAKEAALARVAELEAELAKRG